MKASPYAWLALLVTGGFTLATGLELRAQRSTPRVEQDNFFKKLLGDGRRMFANQFIVMADVYFHSGYYPSVFDRRDGNAAKGVVAGTASGHKEDHSGHKHDAEGHCIEVEKENHSDHQHDEHGHCEEHDDAAKGFMGEPRDWIERFGRRFKVTEHTHLENGQQREILPWLRLAADMDPQMVQTYTVAAFWLRSELGQVKEAEEFLREGLRNNPDSYEILFELGRLYNETSHDTNRARNVWQMALRRWEAQNLEAKKESIFPYEQITVNLGRLEAAAGNSLRAIQYLDLAKQVSPNPANLQRQIDEIQAKASGNTPPSPSVTPQIFPP